MNDLEDLVREALKNAPGETSIANPVEVISGRVRRARQRLAAGVGIAAVALVAAVVVPLTTIHGSGPASVGTTGSPSPTPVTHEPAFGNLSVWLRHRGAQDVTPGKDATGSPVVWAVGYATQQSNGAATPIFELNPVTGAVLGTMSVPSPADRIYFGLGRVWTFGGGDGGYPNGAISRIDPATGAVTTLQLHGGPGGPMFIGSAAYASIGPRGELVQIGGASGPLRRTTSLSGVTAGPELVAPDGTIWIEQTSSWAHLAVRSGTPQLLGMVPGWHGLAVGVGKGDTLWTIDKASGCHLRLAALSLKSTGVSASYGTSIATAESPQDVFEAPDGGIYVSSGSQGCVPAQGDDLTFYPAAALNSSDPQPTAEQQVEDLYLIASDPAGGVVYVLGDTTVLRWSATQP
jgi:hypothetical protein